jgi:chromosomal replication initiator protein
MPHPWHFVTACTPAGSSMTLVHNTRSELQDHLLAERKRIRAEWRKPARPAVASAPSAPLPLQNIKPVEARIAEVDVFRDEITNDHIKYMKDVIRRSASYECTLEVAAPSNPTIPKIQCVVAEHFSLSRDQILSGRRLTFIRRPRQIAMYLSKVLTRRSYPDIGRRFGGRNHATVMHAVRKIKALIAADAAFAEEIDILRRMLTS